jgi:hypothetical protein
MLKKTLTLALVIVFIFSSFLVNAEEEVEVTFVSQEFCEEYFREMLGYKPMSYEEDDYLVFIMANGELLRSPMVEIEGKVFVLSPLDIHSDVLEDWSLIGIAEDAIWAEDCRWVNISWVVGTLEEYGFAPETETDGETLNLVAKVGERIVLEESGIDYIDAPFNLAYIPEQTACQIIYKIILGLPSPMDQELASF